MPYKNDNADYRLVWIKKTDYKFFKSKTVEKGIKVKNIPEVVHEARKALELTRKME